MPTLEGVRRARNHAALAVAATLASLSACSSILGDEFTTAPDVDGSPGPMEGDADAADSSASVGSDSTTGGKPEESGPHMEAGAPQDSGLGLPDSGLSADDAPLSEEASNRPCATLDDCPVGKNCQGGACVDATVGCSAQKSAYPQSPDGIYWIVQAGVPEHAFCDMELEVELCTESSGEHIGRTREGSGLDFAMSSVLLYGQGLCKTWALRGSNGYPLTALNPAGHPTLGTCAALGFVSDGTSGACPYGTSTGFSACGYSVTSTYQYGNVCLGCAQGAGTFATYVLQGPINTGYVLSNFDGTTATTCRIR
jgi:hypothetical protein